MLKERTRGRRRKEMSKGFVYHASYNLTDTNPVSYLGVYVRPNRTWQLEVRESEFKPGRWVFELTCGHLNMISEYDYKTRNTAAAGAWYEMHRWDEELDFETQHAE